MWRRIITRGKKVGHALYALAATLRYVWWYRQLTIVAVTGTDGKSSTVLLTAHLLRAAGYQVAHYSSISCHDGTVEIGNHAKMTMPGKGQLHQFLAQAAKRGVTHAVVEVTSEGIIQYRHRGICFVVVAYTNITPEHIERHGSFASYVDAKLSLVRGLKASGVVVWNSNDPVLRANQHRLSTYSNIPVAVPDYVNEVSVFRLRNEYFARAIVRDGLGEVVDCHDEMTKLFIPGRFEILKGATTVVVDYAHTLEALPLCLRAARAMTTGQLIHVFGAAGGGRDRYKRPELAKISEQYADVHVLTEENSFDEPVEAILEEIAAGFTSGHPVVRFPRREDAIRYALTLAGPQDVVVCTAKGSETVIAGPYKTMRPYHERAFVKTCLTEKASS